MKQRCIPSVAVLLAAFFVCAGYSCRNSDLPVQLEILTFTMKWPQIPRTQRSQLIQDLQNGSRTVADVQFGRLTCDFVNDATAAAPLGPTVSLNGTPANSDLNFNYALTRVSRAPNLGSCTPGTNEIPNEILIQSDRNLAVGRISKAGNIELAFGNDRFTSDYQEITLTNVDVARRSVTAQFQIMATNHANSQDNRVLIIVDGSIVTHF